MKDTNKTPALQERVAEHRRLGRDFARALTANEKLKHENALLKSQLDQLKRTLPIKPRRGDQDE